jgi:hypothetical protein
MQWEVLHCVRGEQREGLGRDREGSEKGAGRDREGTGKEERRKRKLREVRK